MTRIVTLLYDAVETKPWYHNLLMGLHTGLSRLGYVPYLEDAQQTRERGRTRHSGPVLLTRYTCYDVLDLLGSRRGVLMEQETHTPLTTHVPPTDLLYHHPHVALITVPSRGMEHYIARHSSLPLPLLTLGFPYESATLAARRGDVDRDPRLVVIPAVVDEHSRPYWTLDLARRLITAGYRVVWSNSADHTIPAHYPTKTWESEIGLEVVHNDQDGVYRLLRQAAVALCTNQSGTAGVGHYEAWLLGARPVMPKGTDDFPPYHDAFGGRYALWDHDDAFARCTATTPVGVDTTLFDPVTCCRRLLWGLRGRHA